MAFKSSNTAVATRPPRLHGVATAPPAKSRSLRTGSIRTREMIMDAATEEFGVKGFDGARVDEIALRAGVHKNVIYHHFGGKDQLFTAVLEHMYRIIRKRQQDLKIRNLGPIEGMHRLVVFTGKVWLQYPHFQRLIYSANMHGGRHLRASQTIATIYNPLLATINDLLERGSETGVFRKDIDPIDLYVSISALTAHYVSKSHSLEVIFQQRMMTSQRLRQRFQHASEMILRFVLTDPESWFNRKG